MAAMIYSQVTLGRPLAKVEAGDFVFADVLHEPGRVLAPHGHAPLHICYVIAGDFVEGGCVAGGVPRNFSCTPGTLIVKRPGHEHWNRIGPNGARSLAIAVGARIVQRLCDLKPCMPDHYVSIVPRARQLAACIHHELLHPCVSRPMLESLAFELLTLLVQPARSARCWRRPGWLLRVCEILRDAPRDFRGLDALAAQVGIHPVHLARSFRKSFGCTVGDYLRQMRVAHAVRLLNTTGLSIAEIAVSTGFADQAHLTRVFRRATGVTPGAFRRKACEA